MRFSFALFSSVLVSLYSTITYSQVAYSQVLVLAGGGSEGDMGDTSSWSYNAYSRLIENGDINFDDQITVAVLSANEESNWIPNYFESMGADNAYNVYIPSKKEANDSDIYNSIINADVIFIKGGDQGVYYDEWNDTFVEDAILNLFNKKGAIGGTSAGAMSLSQFAFAGGKDYISLDVLQDAKTPYLNDVDGGSGIHNDFLGLIPNTLVDTHYITRGRLGRTAGIIAKIAEDFGTNVLGLGIDEKTALFIKDGIAEVIGVGAVDFMHSSNNSKIIRNKKRPLVFTNIVIDRLTESWLYDLNNMRTLTEYAPATASSVSFSEDNDKSQKSVTILGSNYDHEERFERVIEYDPYDYNTKEGSALTYMKQTMGLTNAHDDEYRGACQAGVFRALYDYPSYNAVLVAESSQINISKSSELENIISSSKNPLIRDKEAASIIIDGHNLTYKDLSAFYSNLDTGSKTLKEASFVNVIVHIIGESDKNNIYYNAQTHSIYNKP